MLHWQFKFRENENLDSLKGTNAFFQYKVIPLSILESAILCNGEIDNT
jgi:hypothetical protein